MISNATFPPGATGVRWIILADSDSFIHLPNLINELRTKDASARFHSGKGVDAGVIDGAKQVVVSRGPGFYMPVATFEAFRAHLRGVDIAKLVLERPDVSDETYMSMYLTKHGHPLEVNDQFYLYWPEYYPKGTNLSTALGFHLSLRWKAGSGVADFAKYAAMFGMGPPHPR